MLILILLMLLRLLEAIAYILPKTVICGRGLTKSLMGKVLIP